jgi:hypothetical protein
MVRNVIGAVSVALAAYAAGSSVTLADEGMWTFDNFPSARVAEQYGVKIDQAWLDRVRLGTARLEGGCSGSFVSPDGLVLTNHHCVESCIAERSTPDRDLLAQGFLAGTREREERCERQQISVLVGMENVTAQIESATKGLGGDAANRARKAEQTRLEQACRDASAKDAKTGPLFCESVTLYQGGQYWLYKYKRYDDVRLVFAPERDVAAFGGDPDNFQFPRWCLDMSLLRVYENGKPASTPNHLAIDFAGPAEGQVTFVSGHPGGTDRLLTTAELTSLRNGVIPFWLLRASELRGRLIQFGEQGPEQARQVEDTLNSIENGIKVRRKQLDALLDDRVFAERAQQEAELQAWLKQHPELAAQVGDPWADVARAQQVWRDILVRYTFLESGAGFNNTPFNYARALVRAAAERQKPNADRLREYTDSRLPALSQQLKAAVPVYPDVERLKFRLALERMREYLGPDDPLVRQVFGNESAQQVATRLIEGTKLGDPKVRGALYDGGQAAIDASDDPLIALAKAVDAESRALRKRYEDEVEGPTRSAQERISKVRFAALGTGTYPDATFTLRLSYGKIAGWNEKGQPVSPFTKLARAFERATGEPPFRMPRSWVAAKDRLDLETRFNMSSTHDIVGGNSGSAMLDANGNVVGLIFDGNIHSISGSYWYDTELNRAVSVDTTIIREALTKVYGADAIVRELESAKSKKKARR